MSNQDDRWLWFIDDAPLQALLKAEGELGTMKMRAASSPALVRAVTAHIEGRTAEAVKELQQAVSGGERQPELFLLLGQMQFEAREYDAAAATYRKLNEIDPQNAVAAFNGGVCFEKLTRWNEAAAAFRRAAELDGERKESWLGYGLCSLHRRRPEDALDAFTRYLEHEPENESALFGRAVALQLLRRFDEAAAIYDRFRTGEDSSPELLTNLLALNIARKDNVGLMRVGAELARLRPGNRQAGEALAYGSVLAGQWETAGAELEKLAAENALAEDWAHARAYCFLRCGKKAEAMAAVSQVLKHNPSHGPALLLQGALWEENGKTKEALAAYRKAANHLAEPEAAWWNLARLAASEGQADLCQQASKVILDRNRNSAEGWYAAGLAGAVDGRSRDAVTGFREALRLRPEWAEVEWNLGLSLLELGEFKRAGDSLRSASSKLKTPVSPEPIVRSLLEDGQIGKALTSLEAAPAGTVFSPEIVFNLAVALQDQGEMASAERLYRRLETADAKINLGHVLLAVGQPEQAESCWRRAAEMETEARA